MEEFHLGETVGILTISLFVAGYCVGPLLWGPLSEVSKMRTHDAYVLTCSEAIRTATYFCLAIPRVHSTCLFTRRGLQPSFSSAQLGIPSRFCSIQEYSIGAYFPFPWWLLRCCPSHKFRVRICLSVTFTGLQVSNHLGFRALISDVWDAETRGKALAIFTVAPFSGPALGPTVAGFLAVAGVSWRWVFWILTIFVSRYLPLIFFGLHRAFVRLGYAGSSSFSPFQKLIGMWPSDE